MRSSISGPIPEAFTINIRWALQSRTAFAGWNIEFGQQKVGAKPTRAESEDLLNEQLAQAEDQKSMLVVASVQEGFAWSRWLAWGFGVAVLISMIALWIQRRAHRFG